MDEDFYIEETNPIKVIFTIIIILGLISGGIWAYYNYIYERHVKLYSRTFELGTKLPTDIDDYIKSNDNSKYSIDLSSVSVDDKGYLNNVGEYSYKVTSDNTTKKGKIYVEDTRSPSVKTQTITVGVDEEFDPSEFILSCDDLSLPCSASYKNKSDEELNKKVGTYKVKLIVEDSEGNTTLADAILIVSKDETLEGKKTSDLEADKSKIDDLDWDETFTLKLDKAINEESEKYEGFSSLVSSYEYNFSNEISNQELIIIQNKYGYVIGFSVKITFTDGKVVYAKRADVKESSLD